MNVSPIEKGAKILDDGVIWWPSGFWGCVIISGNDFHWYAYSGEALMAL